MLSHTGAFSGFSTNDLAAARAFYAETLGLAVEEGEGMLNLQVGGGQRVVIYPKDDHQPATYTVLNFDVPDIDAAVDELGAAGIELQRYEGTPQDDRGVMREWGPPIAWFTDPAGNILSVIQTS
ncbi:MAG TPA: VOC family protein [Candidatus Limnocylindria bacterium]|jgi:catechol 2,3-dioxygenase-like lactoylglutathione lyase family enzyme|nr:VOC family protein [Candidatus Limnocylindria bacterium]